MEEERKVESLLREPLEGKGYELASVHYLSTKEGMKLEVVVDRVEPIGLEDIVDLSGLISEILDKEDPIPGAYTLDVSSLGAEKPIALEKLPLYVGKYVNLHLSHPFKGENILEGHLLKIEEGTLTLEVKQKAKKVQIAFPLPDVDKARLAIEF